MQWSKIILIIILALALFLRVWRLDSAPDGVYVDEASIGYDAFSVLNTGKDFHNHPLPLFFESFGEWKNPVYIYAAIPSVAILGLNAFSTRLPAAIFGSFAILALFLVARELFDEKIALLASAFMAISPWALQFSRIAFEATALPALFLFALWLFLRGFRNPRLWILSAVFFALCLYVYGASRLFIPLFLIALCWIFRSRLINARKQLILPIIIFLLLALPLAYIALFTPKVLLAREQIVGIVSTPGHSLSEFWGNYGQYFSSDFLFNKGDANLRHSLPGYGQLLWFLAPLILAGIAKVLIFFRNDRSGKVLFAWLILFPVAAALTWEGVPHATRSIVGIGLFEIFAAAGVFSLFDFIRRRFSRKITIAISIIFLFFAASGAWRFVSDYFFKYPMQSTAWYESGLGDAFDFIRQNQDSYDNIALTSQLDQARMYAAFYLNLSPEIVQSGNYGKIVQCGPYQCIAKGKVLMLKRAWEPQYGEVLRTFKNVAGVDAFKVEELHY